VKRFATILVAISTCLSAFAAPVAAVTPTGPYLTASFPYSGVPLASAQGPSKNPANILTFTVTNANLATVLTGIAFSLTLPMGLHVADSTASYCGGSLVTKAPVGINFSGGSITFSGGSLAARTSCNVPVYVVGWTVGYYKFSSSLASSTQNPSGTRATTAADVIAAPVLVASFSPATITLGSTAALNFAISNPAGNLATLVSVGVITFLPSDLSVTTTQTSPCGGILKVTAPGTIALFGAVTIGAGQACSFSVPVKVAATGKHTITTEKVTSVDGGVGNSATSTLTVVAVAPATAGPTASADITTTATPSAGDTGLLAADASGVAGSASPIASQDGAASVAPSASPLAGAPQGSPGDSGLPLILVTVAAVGLAVLLAFLGYFVGRRRSRS
jgi:hypothetical protein